MKRRKLHIWSIGEGVIIMMLGATIIAAVSFVYTSGQLFTKQTMKQESMEKRLVKQENFKQRHNKEYITVAKNIAVIRQQINHIDEKINILVKTDEQTKKYLTIVKSEQR
jgi:hypothetical protein